MSLEHVLWIACGAVYLMSAGAVYERRLRWLVRENPGGWTHPKSYYAGCPETVLPALFWPLAMVAWGLTRFFMVGRRLAIGPPDSDPRDTGEDG